MSLVMRKPVFGVFDQVRPKPDCSSTETNWSLEILDIEIRGIILSRKWTIETLIRLRGCAGWSAHLLFAYGINRFSHDMAHIISVYLMVWNFWLYLTFGYEHIWATSCQNQQNGSLPSKDSDQPGHPPSLIRVFAVHWQWVAKDPSFLHVDCKDSDQTGRMPRLIRVFSGCMCHFVAFVMRWLIYEL